MDALEKRKAAEEKEKALNDWLPMTSNRNATWWFSAFHNVTAMVGAGVLGLPYAMSQLGWGPGITWRCMRWYLERGLIDTMSSVNTCSGRRKGGGLWRRNNFLSKLPKPFYLLPLFLAIPLSRLSLLSSDDEALPPLPKPSRSVPNFIATNDTRNPRKAELRRRLFPLFHLCCFIEFISGIVSASVAQPDFAKDLLPVEKPRQVCGLALPGAYTSIPLRASHLHSQLTLVKYPAVI